MTSTPDTNENDDDIELKPRRGRPPGSRNKPETTSPLTPPSFEALADYKSADPMTIISRQLAMLDWAQQACRIEMQRGMQKSGVRFDAKDIDKLAGLASAIVKTVDALKKSTDLAEELAKRMTPEQLLEAALAKVEAQDTATIAYAIKRLRAHRERIAPPTRLPYQSASDAVAGLEEAE